MIPSAFRQQLAAARSLLFVPGDRPDRFGKAAGSEADVVVVDLEDSVGASRKGQAREYVRAWLEAGHEAMVRINAPDTAWHDEDVRMVRGRSPAVMVPKAENGADVDRLARALGGDIPVVPLIETATGVLRVESICAVANVVRPAFGNVDLAAQLGIAATSCDALRHVRSTIVLAAAATDCAGPIDGVTTALDDPDILEMDVDHARMSGFTGKLCIHPGQVLPVNRGFQPSEHEIAWAKEILTAANVGSAVRYGGQMVDRPVLERARSLLAAVTRKLPTEIDLEDKEIRR